jgi:hypothetical protein
MFPLTRELFMQETRKVFATLKRHDSFSTLLGVISTRRTPQHMKIILKRVSEKFFLFLHTHFPIDFVRANKILSHEGGEEIF